VLSVLTLRQQFAGADADTLTIAGQPEMIWELTFGIYLVARGFTSLALRRDAPARRAPAPVPAVG
jgi:hypothetical protein